VDTGAKKLGNIWKRHRRGKSPELAGASWVCKWTWKPPAPLARLRERPVTEAIAMFGQRLPLFRLFGFEVRFDLTWLIFVALIVWSLSVGYFPSMYEGYSALTYFSMAIVGAIGLFASIVLHELAHSLVARRFGMEIRGITLFIFGGAAEMADEPPSPRAEALMALAGPAVSLALGVILYAVSSALDAAGAPDPIIGVTAYLGGINLILAAFNLIPAYPLDGGRVLRAALWAWRRDLHWATDVAAQVGGAFGLVLVALGIFEVVIGRVGDGMWLFLIGLFLRAAAAASYQRMVARETLTGIPVASLMTRAPVAGTPDACLSDLVDSHFLGRSLKLVPIVDNNGRLVGSIDARQVKAIPRADWASTRAVDVMTPISRENTIDALADAATALERMQGAGRSRLMVADGDHLEGILTLRDMLQALNLRRDLGEPPPRGAWREPPSRPAGAHGD